MTSVAVAALRPHVDIEQASHYIEVLYRDAPGFGSLILLGNERRERHSFFEVTRLIDDPLTSASSREALQDVVDQHWNVYASMATFGAIPEKGRGTRADVASVPGVWADLDVKPDTEGYFASESEVVAYQRFLPPPTFEIASGSGGRHLYWLTHERLDASRGQELLVSWLDFLRDAAAGKIIENVHDTTRILRVPGTVRWPKIADSVPMPRKVEIINEGPRYYADELLTLSSVAHDGAQRVRNALRRARIAAEESRRAELVSRGLRFESYERIVRTFRLQQDWAGLLENTGWTLHSDQRDGAARCRYWTRPGKSVADGKSAATDFVDKTGMVSHLMTLYSNDPILTDLRENDDELDAVGVVTKWRYALKRIYNGDEASLLRDVAKNGGRLS